MLAAYTYSSGLRAPALIAFVKDALIYLVIAVAIIYIPIKLGGFDAIFAHGGRGVRDAQPGDRASRAARWSPAPAGQWAYATLALGSALALFMYPHSITATLSSRSRNVIRRNTTILPLYSLMLGLLALLGFMAIAGRASRCRTRSWPSRSSSRTCSPTGSRASRSPRSASARWCPPRSCPSPRRTCSPATSTRTSSSRTPRPQQETKVSKLVSLLVKVGALVFVLTMDKTVAINFQLLGGIWILQTMPALVGGLFTRWFHRWALLAGWAVGMVYGTLAAYGVASPTQTHFGGSAKEIPGIGEIGYIGLTAFVLNVVVTVVLTFVLKALKAPRASTRRPPRTTRRTPATRASEEAAGGDGGNRRALTRPPPSTATGRRIPRRPVGVPGVHETP